MRLYHHKTDGGAEYLSDKYVVCPDGSRERVFEGASIIVRLDGDPEVHLRGKYAAATDLLAASKAFVDDFIGYINSDDYDLPDPTALQAAIAKAEAE